MRPKNRWLDAGGFWFLWRIKKRTFSNIPRNLIMIKCKMKKDISRWLKRKHEIESKTLNPRKRTSKHKKYWRNSLVQNLFSPNGPPVYDVLRPEGLAGFLWKQKACQSKMCLRRSRRPRRSEATTKHIQDVKCSPRSHVKHPCRRPEVRHGFNKIPYFLCFYHEIFNVFLLDKKSSIFFSARVAWI